MGFFKLLGEGLGGKDNFIGRSLISTGDKIQQFNKDVAEHQGQLSRLRNGETQDMLKSNNNLALAVNAHKFKSMDHEALMWGEEEDAAKLKNKRLELENEETTQRIVQRDQLFPHQLASAENANKIEAQKIKQNNQTIERNENLIAMQKEKEAEQTFESNIISGLSKFAEYANAPANVKDSVVSGAKSVLFPYDKALRNFDAAVAGDPKSISNFIHNANKIGLKNVRYDEGAKKFFIQGADGKDVEVTRGTIEDLTEKRSMDTLNSTIAELRANTFVADATAYTTNNYIRKIGDRSKENGAKVDYKNITSNVETVMSRATEREKIALVITTAGYQLLDGKLNQESKAMLAQSLVPLVQAQGFQVDIDKNTGAVSVIDPINNKTYTDREFVKFQEEQSQGLRDQLDSLVPPPNAELVAAQQAKEREKRVIDQANLEAKELNVNLSAINQYVTNIIDKLNLQDDGITEEYGRQVRVAIYDLAENLRKEYVDEKTRKNDIRNAYKKFIDDTKLKIGGRDFSPTEEILFVDPSFLPKLIEEINHVEEVRKTDSLSNHVNSKSKYGYLF